MKAEIKWLSPVIGQEYKEWERELILIDSQTGTGKTSFIFNELYSYTASKGKKILYLCNRSALRLQINKSKSKSIKKMIRNFQMYDQSDITDDELFTELDEYLTVGTYQALQKKILKHEILEHYSYIICDECHYFFADAVFNMETDVAFNYLVGKRKKVVVIFMSATAKPLYDLLKENFLDMREVYSPVATYDFIEKIHFYSEKEELMELLRAIDRKNEKVFLFTNDKNTFANVYTSEFKEKSDFFVVSIVKIQR